MVTSRELFNYYSKEGKVNHCQRRMYADGAHANLRRIIINLLSLILKKDAICLDVGCAEGWYTKWLGKRAAFSVGIDISLLKLKRASVESNSDNVDYIMASWNYLPFRGESFTTIIFIEGPEHSLEPKVTLNELYRVAKPYGFLLVSAPIEEISPRKDPLAEPYEGHISFFSTYSLRNLVAERFSIIRVRFPSTGECIVQGIKSQISKTRFADIMRKIDHLLLGNLILKRSPVPHGIIVGMKMMEGT